MYTREGGIRAWYRYHGNDGRDTTLLYKARKNKKEVEQEEEGRKKDGYVSVVGENYPKQMMTAEPRMALFS